MNQTVKPCHCFKCGQPLHWTPGAPIYDTCYQCHEVKYKDKNGQEFKDGDTVKSILNIDGVIKEVDGVLTVYWITGSHAPVKESYRSMVVVKETE